MPEKLMDSFSAAERLTLVMRIRVARLSNCGNPLKPLNTKHVVKAACGQVNDLGYGNSVKGCDNGKSAAKS